MLQYCRAKKELHIITKDRNQTNSHSYSSLFLSYCQNLRSNNNGEFEWGKSNINTDLNEDLREDFVLNVNSNLKWKNKIYYDLSINKFEYKREEGLLLHELLSQINSIDEIDFVLKNHENLKILNDFNVRTLKSKIFKIFNHKTKNLLIMRIKYIMKRKF